VIVPLIGVAWQRALDRGQERVLRGGDLVGGDAIGVADGGKPGGGAVVTDGRGADDRCGRRPRTRECGGVEGVDRATTSLSSAA
jgi:hypothetical protein